MCCAMRKTLRSYRRINSSKAATSPPFADATRAISSETGSLTFGWIAPIEHSMQDFSQQTEGNLDRKPILPGEGVFVPTGQKSGEHRSPGQPRAAVPTFGLFFVLSRFLVFRRSVEVNLGQISCAELDVQSLEISVFQIFPAFQQGSQPSIGLRKCFYLSDSRFRVGFLNFFVERDQRTVRVF